MADKSLRLLQLTLGVLMLVSGLAVLYLRYIVGEFLSVITAIFAYVAAVGAFWVAKWARTPPPTPPRLPAAVLAQRRKQSRVLLVLVILAIIAVTGWNIAMAPDAWVVLVAFTVLIASIMVLAFRWAEARFRSQ